MQQIKITLEELEMLINSRHKVLIDTPSGKEAITDTYRKQGKGRKIQFNNNEELYCSDKHLIWKEEWKTSNQFKVGDTIGNKTIKKIDTVPKQEWIDFTVDASHSSYYHQGILHHNSGKSLIIYCLIRWHLLNKRRQLIIVPTTSLVEQMYSDFQSYSQNNGWKASYNCYRIYGTVDKNSDMPIVISTWQSLYKLPKSYFQSFDVIYGDECHLFQAKSLTGIMNKCVNAPFRIGTTGTLDGSKVNKLVLEGLFGPVYRTTTTKELIDSNRLADLKIFAIVLQYSDQVKKNCKDLKYRDELDFLVQMNERNKFIRNLALDQKGNTLVLFQLVEKQGKLLYDMIWAKCGDRKVFFVYGGTDTQQREEIRQITEKETDAIIVASYGTFSTGINIRNLHNIIFASPSKSRIRNLQSIGRGLRIGENKQQCKLYDIGDDLTWKTRKNYTLYHMMERIKIYADEEFDYSFVKVPISA